MLQVPQQQNHQPLLNGPVPAGVIPTVGVDHTPQNPSTSEASHSGYGRPRNFSESYSNNLTLRFSTGTASGVRATFNHHLF